VRSRLLPAVPLVEQQEKRTVSGIVTGPTVLGARQDGGGEAVVDARHG